MKAVKITLNLVQFLALFFRLRTCSSVLFLSVGQYYKWGLYYEFLKICNGKLTVYCKE